MRNSHERGFEFVLIEYELILPSVPKGLVVGGDSSAWAGYPKMSA